MPSEMTLHERLREAATTAVKLHDGAHTYFNVSPSSLAAIERDIRAEAQAPWRDAVNQWRRECHALRAENAALRRAGHTLREAAAKAWTNGVSDIEDSAALYDAINVWDATVDPEVVKEFPGIFAAAEAAIREDAIAPWRERVDKAERELRMTSERQAQTIHELNDLVVAERTKYDALKARADELEEKSREAWQYVKPEYIGKAREVLELCAAYSDAADRAGETNDDGTRGSSGSHCGDDCDSNPADRGVGCGLVDQSQAVAPSPSDINWHGEFGLVVGRDGKTSSWVKSDTHPHLNYDTRPVAPSPTDAAAEGDVAPWERFWLSQSGQIADLERWREAREKELDTLTDDLVADRKKIESLEQRLDALESPNGQAASGEPVVTDRQRWISLMAWIARKIGHPEDRYDEGYYDALEAVMQHMRRMEHPDWQTAALRAGGAKQ